MSTAHEAIGAVSAVCGAAVPLGRLEAEVADLAARYQRACPFPHVVIEDFLARDWAEGLARVFPKPDGEAWTAYRHFNENKFGNTKRHLFPPQIGAVVDELNSPPFIAWLSRLTGIQGLFADPSLEGGGMHQTPRGGFLNVHADFTMHHHKPTWRRRCNLIVYLNPDWDEAWGGAIQLWDDGMRRAEVCVTPAMNRAVIFNTTESTYHGYPDPITCPEDTTRKSLALYYYTEEASGNITPRSTNYRATPADGPWRRFSIYADKTAVAVYSIVKKRFGLSDDFASRMLRFLANRH